jgi:hypothetical protein
VLKHASRSRHIDPDRPPAAAGGLRSQVPDLVHGPRELLDCRQLQQAGRRERTRFFDRRSKAGIDLAASAITLGRQSHVRRCPADDQRRSGLESFYDHKTSQCEPNHSEDSELECGPPAHTEWTVK